MGTNASEKSKEGTSGSENHSNAPKVKSIECSSDIFDSDDSFFNSESMRECDRHFEEERNGVTSLISQTDKESSGGNNTQNENKEERVGNSNSNRNEISFLISSDVTKDHSSDSEKIRADSFLFNKECPGSFSNNSKEAFSFIDSMISAADPRELTNESDNSSKRHKSSSSIMEDTTFDQKIFSGFKTGKNQDIFISDPDQKDVASTKTLLSATKFMKDLVSSLSQASEENEDFLFEEGNLEIPLEKQISCYNTNSTQIILEKAAVATNSYTKSIDNKGTFIDSGEKIIESGFKTGNNRNIMIDTRNLKKGIDSISFISEIDENTSDLIEDELGLKNNTRSTENRINTPDFNKMENKAEQSSSDNTKNRTNESISGVNSKNIEYGRNEIKNKFDEQNSKTNIKINTQIKCDTVDQSDKLTDKVDGFTESINHSHSNSIEYKGPVISNKVDAFTESINHGHSNSIEYKRPVISNKVDDFTESINHSHSNSIKDKGPVISNKVDDFTESINHSHSNEMSKIESSYGITGVKNRLMNINTKEEHEIKTTDPDLLLKNVYFRIKEAFKKEDPKAVFNHFKWAWLHLVSNPNQQENSIAEEAIEIVRLKFRYEKSILKRIVEFDDVPFRFMILGVIDFTEEHIELFDGFYSLRFQIDKNIHTLLVKNRCTLGTKMLVFGATLLLKQPTGILEVEGPALKLMYNGIRIIHDSNLKLGVANKISFLNKIKGLHPEGGTVSALIVRIKKIFEIKYLVTVENYVNRVDDLEKEIEKILEIAAKTGHKINVEDINARQYAKMLIEDGTGECILVWWNPPEVKAEEKYKLVLLNASNTYLGLQLSTTKKTYYEKIDSKAN